MIGFDNLSINHSLLLGLPFTEPVAGADVMVNDRATPHHPCLSTGATIASGAVASGFPYYDFTSATPDYVRCLAADTGDLDFVAGDDFSMVAWVYIDDLTGSRSIISRGLAAGGGTDGWDFLVNNAGRIGLATYQAGADQVSYGMVNVVINNWFLVGATYSTPDALLYLNGYDRTDAPDTHIAPLTSTRDLRIGYRNDNDYPFSGYMTWPRIWERRLSNDDMLYIWITERHWFAV